MKHSSNGNGNIKKIEDLKQESISYPVTYDLKAVMDGGAKTEESQNKISEVLRKHKMNFHYKSKKHSSKGSYVSFTFQVTIESQEQMHEVYNDLKKLDGLKFAV
jgi:putative lipoic acid-binding regulatory protein